MAALHETRVCPHCSSEFVTKRRDQTYCSVRCRKNASYDRRADERRNRVRELRVLARSAPLPADCLDRLLAKTEQDPETGCWVWQGYRDRRGYGRFTVDRGRAGVLAHRVAYELLVQAVPADLTLDHLCRNTSCVNPAHLEPVPLAVNILRGESPPAQNARKTHCPRGHAYTAENTHVDPNGWRDCRECSREYDRLRRPRRQAA